WPVTGRRWGESAIGERGQEIGCDRTGDGGTSTTAFDDDCERDVALISRHPRMALTWRFVTEFGRAGFGVHLTAGDVGEDGRGATRDRGAHHRTDRVDGIGVECRCVVALIVDD